jgi:hypothetical protein
VDGENYPVDPIKGYLSKVVTMLQMTMFGILMGGVTVTDMLGITGNAAVKYIQENHMMVGAGTFLMCTQAKSWCSATGAFEIYIDSELVFSKLEAGYLPEFTEMSTMFAKYGIGFRPEIQN